MKTFLGYFLFFIFSMFTLVSCSTSREVDTVSGLKIGVTSVPHGDILNNIKNVYGLDFEIINYIDYTKLNDDLINNVIDANFFQTNEYLDYFNLDSGGKLIKLAEVHVEPLIIYSNKYRTIDNVESGDTVYIPSDIINKNRALKLLQSANLITLAQDSINGEYVVAINPKNLVIIDVPSNEIPQYYKDADLALMNTNVALENNIDPKDNGIFYENSFNDEGKYNVFVTREDMSTSVELKEIANYLNGDVTFNFIMDKYNGFVKPVF